MFTKSEHQKSVNKTTLPTRAKKLKRFWASNRTKSIISMSWVCRTQQNVTFRDLKTQPIRYRLDRSNSRLPAPGVPFHPGVWATAAKDL